MYQKYTKLSIKLKLILFFMMIIGADLALHAGRRTGRVNRLRLARNRTAIINESQRRKQMGTLEQDIAKAEAKQQIAQAEQLIEAAEQQIESEEVYAQQLEEKLASEPVGSEQKGFFMNQWERAKRNASALKQAIINNKEKIAAAAVTLGSAFLAYKFFTRHGGIKWSEEQKQVIKKMEKELNAATDENEKKEITAKGWAELLKDMSQEDQEAALHSVEKDLAALPSEEQKQSAKGWLQKAKNYLEISNKARAKFGLSAT